jgi:hypothetical protein
MKDQLVLLLTAIVVATLAWAFFHYLGQDAWPILSALVIIVLTSDNVRLRRQVKELKSGLR